MNVDLKYISESVINNAHGWAVSDQFSSTFSGEQHFEEQNYSALELISSTLRDLVRSEALAEGYELDELKRYEARLEEYLSKA